MKKSEKQEQEQLLRILGMNPPPEPDPKKRNALMGRLVMDAYDMDYMGADSLAEMLAVQASYLSPWDFLLQGGVLAAMFYCALQGMQLAVIYLAALMAPLMTGVLLYELSKTFGHNMWEMESACRYNLPQLFFLRLCILSGGDFIVLAASLVAFRMAGGRLWQFSLCVLLPFFLNSALYMYALQHMGKWHVRFLLLCIGVAVEGICIGPYFMYENGFLEYQGIGIPDRVFTGAAGAALAVFLLCAYRLCTKKYYVSAVSM